MVWFNAKFTELLLDQLGDANVLTSAPTGE
jgi:hypothetical protein